MAADQILFESEAAVERCADVGITPRHGDWDRTVVEEHRQENEGVLSAGMSILAPAATNARHGSRSHQPRLPMSHAGCSESNALRSTHTERSTEQPAPATRIATFASERSWGFPRRGNDFCRRVPDISSAQEPSDYVRCVDSSSVTTNADVHRNEGCQDVEQQTCCRSSSR